MKTVVFTERVSFAHLHTNPSENRTPVGEAARPHPASCTQTARPASKSRRFTTATLVLLLASTLLSVPSYAQQPFRIADKQTFFSGIDLDYPGLGEVKEAVEAQRYDEAADLYFRFIDNRTDRRFMYGSENRSEVVADLRRLYPDFEQKTMDKANRTLAFELPIEGAVYRWDDGDITWRDENKEWINVQNRMAYLNDMGLAYWFTGDEKYFDCWWHWIEEWIEDNPVPDYPVELTGGTWNPYRQSYTAPHGPWRALEAGIRIGNWLQSYYYFAASSRFTADRKWKFFRSAMEHTRYLYDYLRRGACGNWETTVSSGIIPLVVMTPEWKNSDDLLQFCKKTLSNNLKSAINDDGFQFELTVDYHRHVGESATKAVYFISELNRLPGLDDEATDKLRKTYDLIVSLKKPDNSNPSMGDMGVYFKGARSETVRDDAEFFGRATVLFGDPVYKTLAGSFTAEDYVYFGKTGYDKFTAVPSLPDLTLESCLLPASKLAVMRSGKACRDDENGSLYCLFDNSPDGAGSHNHHDYLNIELFAYDKTLVVDPGRGVSYNDPLFTTYYRTVRAHNGVQVGPDEKRQLAKKAGDDVRNEAWESNALYDYARGRLTNYDGVDHERELFFVKGEYWLLRDRLYGEGAPLLKQYFHTLPGPVERQEDGRSFRTRYADCSNLCVVPIGDAPITASIDSGYMNTGNAEHDENLSAPIIAYTQQKSLPTRFETLLFPLKKGEEPPRFDPRPIAAERNDTTAYGFSIVSGEERRDRFYRSDDGHAIRFADGTTLDGTIGFCRERNGAVERIALRGRSLAEKNFALHSTADNDAWLRCDSTDRYTLYSREPLDEFSIPTGKTRGKLQVVCLQDGAWRRLPAVFDRDKATVRHPLQGTVSVRIERRNAKTQDIERR